ncbi:MAG TPA: hypothetical protein ENF77_01810 [Candidatus Acetothermia bacterium]|nr:hypothetical protein [Candidatus Bipolaricaulota bacterium]RLE28692.1 MAG: hypothetical protein DRJ54_06070 [Candidatus Acetothermia bacterium]HDI11041.1 hypothetical protein [Candidatus Acetothermia bacterium]
MSGVLVVAALRTELLFVRHRPVAILGMGDKAAPRLVGLVRRKRPLGVLAVGFCGATWATLPPGALVLASGVDGLEVPGELVERARTMLPRAEVGPVATVKALADPREKARLGLDALAVDMESAPLARQLASLGIPFLILRCVLDALWEDVSIGPRLRWTKRALMCARRLAEGVRTLVPVLERTA